jgi:hypothetical protein
MEGFLQNSEEAKSGVWRHGAWQIVGLEVNLHFLLLAEFLAEASHSSSNTQSIAVSLNATRVTGIEYRQLPPKSASGVRPYGCGLRAE